MKIKQRRSPLCKYIVRHCAKRCTISGSTRDCNPNNQSCNPDSNGCCNEVCYTSGFCGPLISRTSPNISGEY